MDERQAGLPREILASMPYLTDQALLIGGVRGSGRSTLLLQMLHGEYPQAWYTDFSDARLAGFDRDDFGKLNTLIGESGKGILLLDKVDEAQGWAEFIAGRLADGIKVVATVSLDTLLSVQRMHRDGNTVRDSFAGRLRKETPGIGLSGIAGSAAVAGSAGMTGVARATSGAGVATVAESVGEVCKYAEQFLVRRIGPFSYTEFLEALHKRGGEEAVEEYLLRGAFPESCKTGRTAPLLQLYDNIIQRDVLVAKGVRDRVTLGRIALYLLTASGEGVTANAIRNQLKVKAVSTVTEHMEHLEQAGLVSFVPILDVTPGRRAVNPRKVYAVDTALASALSLREYPDKEKLFETLVYNCLSQQYEEICYTPEQGGCDFVVKNDGFVAGCIQACYDGEDPDRLQAKIEGLAEAMRQTGQRRGMIVTLGRSELISVGEGAIEVVDADTFLGR